jgi:hypothetical protein
MIPDIPEASIENSGEREVYRHLRDQLPNNWVVRYHYPVCWMNGPRLREREGDFIVLAPGRGLMFLESKGSHGYTSAGGIWYRVKPDGSTEATGNPFDQVSTFKHRIVERMANDLFHCDKLLFPGIFGHAVIYPKGKVEGPLPKSVDPMVMIGYKDMNALLDRLEASFKAWGARQDAARFTADVMDKTVRYLSDECRMVPVLAHSIDEDEGRLKELTLRQYSAFRGLLRNLRVHVQGTAGSGKTILASWSAQSFADRGERTLLVCFNRTLAAWLQHNQPKPHAYEIRSFFSLCREVITRAGLQFNVPTDEGKQAQFWEVEAPALFCAAIEQSTEDLLPRYDAVIVDEAQDFHQDWWFPLQLLLRDPDHGRLCVFSDPKQAGVYGNGGAFPKGLVSFDLLENCRNTKQITHYCGNVIDHEVVPFPSSPVGVTPEILPPQSIVVDRAKTVQKCVTKLLEQGFLASRIAILSPWRKTSPESTLSSLSAIHGKPIRGDDEGLQLWLNNKCIWASTIKAFKGLEADCIVLTDVPEMGTAGFNVSDLYVATSRAKHLLLMVPTTAGAASQLQQWVVNSKTPARLIP